MLAKRLIKSNDAGGGGGCTNTVDLYNPFPDGGGVALYQLNGNATDVSGNYDATTANAITYGTGEFGQAAQFNGSSSYVLIPDSQALRLTGDYTISFWFKTNSIGATQRLINKDNANDFSGGYALLLESNGTMTWGHNDGSTNQNWNIGVSISTNTWYYVTAVYSGNSNLRSFYLNNVLQDTRTTNTNIASETDVLLFGAYGQSGPLGQYFNGSLDQVRIFSRALRPYEVEALYTEEYCTPTIVPSEHFNTVTYTGNSSTQSVTGVGFQPDLVWIKRRNTTEDHALFDSVRGALKMISSNLTAAEYTTAAPYEAVSSFDSDGFTTGDNGATNRSPNDYVAWNFKAGGSAVTNTDGTITSQVSANVDAGFSVVKYNSGATSVTAGHGLNQAPAMVICKPLVAGPWAVWHKDMGNLEQNYIPLTSAAEVAVGQNIWNYSNWGTTKIGSINPLMFGNGNDVIAYCFAEVEGFSSFGSYVGNDTSKTIVTGFEPAFVMFKCTTVADQWIIFDNKRGVVSNNTDTYLLANLSQQELDLSNGDSIDFLTNGFKVIGDGRYFNQDQEEYIYMAFAADPTTIEPSLEDSFNTVLYTGNSSTPQTVTGMGFQPDMVWQKQRTGAAAHRIVDSIRGSGNYLYPNLTNANDGYNADYMRLASDGVYLPGADSNYATNNYVVWGWKGAELPAINSNGSIPSVVSANPAAGFSIVSYTGTETISTIGHGLNGEPKMIIVKRRENTNDNWYVYNSNLSGINNYLQLNTTAAELTFSPSIWGGSSPTSTVFSVGTDPSTNSLNEKIIAYCFAEVAGFSKFGSYTGNGNVNGPTITTDFEPAFVMTKRTSSDTTGGNWLIFDNKRDTVNPNSKILLPNLSSQELDEYGVDFNATGFQIRESDTDINGSGQTYIYMAFANQF